MALTVFYRKGWKDVHVAQEEEYNSLHWEVVVWMEKNTQESPAIG